MQLVDGDPRRMVTLTRTTGGLPEFCRNQYSLIVRAHALVTTGATRWLFADNYKVIGVFEFTIPALHPGEAWAVFDIGADWPSDVSVTLAWGKSRSAICANGS